MLVAEICHAGYPKPVNTGLRTVIVSYGPAQFRVLHETLATSGHLPVAYMVSRSMNPSSPPDADLLEGLNAVISDLPPSMDLLLPGGTKTISSMLAGYEPDLVLVYGFNWRFPREALDVPRLGTLNVHPSALPKYRGPSPVPWAVRNGDPAMGVTVHRMTEDIDAGPVLAQVDDLPIPDAVTHENIWQLIGNVLPDLLTRALDRLGRGDPGSPQDESRASYAGFPPADWYNVTWLGTRRDLHNQIRVLRLLNGGQGATVSFQGRRVQVHRTSLLADGGVPVEWVTYTEV
jgi:methionyl-tRNA formyltransferase